MKYVQISERNGHYSLDDVIDSFPYMFQHVFLTPIAFPFISSFHLPTSLPFSS